MPVVLMVAGFLRGPFRSFLAGVPRPVWYAIAAIASLALLWHAHAVSVRQAVRAVTVADDARYRAAQAAADTAAHATVARVETAQTAITTETQNDTTTALARIAADYAAYRLLHAAATGAASPGTVSRVPVGTARIAGTACADVAEPVAQLIDFAEQGDEWRADAQGWRDWYVAQLAVNRMPVVAVP
jgi:hypothetical protein